MTDASRTSPLDAQPDPSPSSRRPDLEVSEVTGSGVSDRTLYHYCCGHSAEGIRQLGRVHTNPHPLLGWTHLAWLTDLATPNVDGLGLTRELLPCDRTEFRVTVQGAAEWWPTWARRNNVRRSVRDTLEAYGLPAHWWVAEQPLQVLAIEPTRLVVA